jgi:hypothetical protein
MHLKRQTTATRVDSAVPQRSGPTVSYEVFEYFIRWPKFFNFSFVVIAEESVANRDGPSVRGSRIKTSCAVNYA